MTNPLEAIVDQGGSITVTLPRGGHVRLYTFPTTLHLKQYTVAIQPRKGARISALHDFWTFDLAYRDFTEEAAKHAALQETPPCP
jgi:hypothetical protein